MTPEPENLVTLDLPALSLHPVVLTPEILSLLYPFLHRTRPFDLYWPQALTLKFLFSGFS